MGKKPEREAASNRKAALSTSAGTSVEYWTLRAVHHNKWGDFGRKDFEPVAAASKELLGCFRCAQPASPGSTFRRGMEFPNLCAVSAMEGVRRDSARLYPSRRPGLVLLESRRTRKLSGRCSPAEPSLSTDEHIPLRTPGTSGTLFGRARAQVFQTAR